MNLIKPVRKNHWSTNHLDLNAPNYPPKQPNLSSRTKENNQYPEGKIQNKNYPEVKKGTWKS